MAWTLMKNEAGQQVWQASQYSDLQYAEITNLAQYGQPHSPYQGKFDHDFVPDFQNVIIRLPHKALMYDGHGKNIRPTHFPIITQFLNGQIEVRDGCYSFSRLQVLGKNRRFNRTISGNLYGISSIPTISGSISAGDAAYIYGSVGYALMGSTFFEKEGGFYTVRGEIGVLDDNWDFKSDNIVAKTLNPLIAAIFVDHYNLEPNPNVPDDTMGRIEIEYFGSGKPFLIRNFVPLP